MLFKSSLIACVMLSLSLCVHAQTDSTTKVHVQKPGKPPVNSTKLDLVYLAHQSTSVDSRGMVSSRTVILPYLRVNDKRDIRIYGKGNMLRPYYVKAPLALAQVDIMQHEAKVGKRWFFGGFGVGALLIFSGLPAAVREPKANMPAFYTHLGLGLGAMTMGVIEGMKHNRRWDNALHKSFDIYNDRYYMPPPKDTTPVTAADSTAKKTGKKKQKEEKHQSYSIERNEPENSGLWGFIIDPIVVNQSTYNTNLAGGAGFFYSYKSAFRINASYTMAYVDDALGDDRDYLHLVPGTSQNAAPSDYKPASSLELQTKFNLVSWTKSDGIYPIHLEDVDGAEAHLGKHGDVKANVLHALSGRLGYEMRNQVMDWDIDYVSSTNTNATFSGSPAMLKSGIASVGIGWSIFRDIKVNMGDLHRGRTSLMKQTDVYVDFLYGASMKWQDLMYTEVLPDGTISAPKRADISQTPLTKTGIRVGFENLFMFSNHVGQRIRLEIGLQPGPTTYDKRNNEFIKFSYGILIGGRAGGNN
jgi:hypothetical protein